MLALIVGLGVFNYTHRYTNRPSSREFVEKVMLAEKRGDWGALYDMMDWSPSVKRELDKQGGRDWFIRGAKEGMTGLGITAYKVTSVTEHGDSATGEVHATAMEEGKSVEFDYEVEIRYVGGQWKLVPDLPEGPQDDQRP